MEAKLSCIGTENSCIAYRVGISYSIRPSRTCDSGTFLVKLLAAERKKIYKAKLAGNHITEKTPLQKGNGDRTMKIGEGGRRDLSRT